MYGARKILKYEKGKNLKTTIKLSVLSIFYPVLFLKSQ